MSVYRFVYKYAVLILCCRKPSRLVSVFLDGCKLLWSMYVSYTSKILSVLISHHLTQMTVGASMLSDILLSVTK